MSNSHLKNKRKKRRLNQKRRRMINANIARQNEKYEMIDGNFTYYPYAYCKIKRAWLTINTSITHHCEVKECPNFLLFENIKKGISFQ